MIVVDRKPVPIYELTCNECKSRIQYRASEISICHITCPVCGFSNWADKIAPVWMEDSEDEHGDLIDRDALPVTVEQWNGEKIEYISQQAIKDAPVVIPSNRKEKKYG